MVAQIPFDRSSSAPFHRQVYDGYRAAILDGRLRPGERLPATRDLAAALGISRTPVLDAFERLRYEGYVDGRVGAGTFVARAPSSGDGPGPDRGPGTWPDPVELPADRWLPPGAIEPRHRIRPFHLNVPALDLFPHPVWRRLIRRHLNMSLDEMVAEDDAVGLWSLRELLADHLRVTRLVRCDPEQVFIVTGSRCALQLCAVALLDAGESIGVDESTRHAALRGVGALRVPIELVPPDGDEADDADDEVLVRTTSPRVRFVHVMPSHPYLFGGPMGPRRRRQLLRWSEVREGWILEEDHDSDLCYDGFRPVPLHGEGHGDRVLHLGAFSRTMFPGVRVGYLVVPRALVPTFVRVRRALAFTTPPLHQAAVADFLAEGHYDRHIRTMRRTYDARRKAVVAALRRDGPDLMTVHDVDAGLELAITFDPSRPDEEAVRAAAAAGISTTALSTVYPERNGLVLGFGCAPPDQLDQAARGLITVLRSPLSD